MDATRGALEADAVKLDDDITAADAALQAKRAEVQQHRDRAAAATDAAAAAREQAAAAARENNAMEEDVAATMEPEDVDAVLAELQRLLPQVEVVRATVADNAAELHEARAGMRAFMAETGSLLQTLDAGAAEARALARAAQYAPVSVHDHRDPAAVIGHIDTAVADRELCFRDVIYDLEEKMEASAQLDRSVASLKQKHQQRVESSIEHGHHLAHRFAAAFDGERLQLEALYRRACDVNKELRYHLHRGTHGGRPTQKTQEEKRLHESHSEAAQRVVAAERECDELRRELAELDRAAKAQHDRLEGGRKANRREHAERVARAAELREFVAALKNEKRQWQATRAALDDVVRRVATVM
jgi:hypothetical protein